MRVITPGSVAVGLGSPLVGDQKRPIGFLDVQSAALDGVQRHICLLEGLTISLPTPNGPPAQGSMGSAPYFEPSPPGFAPARQRSGSVEHGQAGAKGGGVAHRG